MLQHITRSPSFPLLFPVDVYSPGSILLNGYIVQHFSWFHSSLIDIKFTIFVCVVRQPHNLSGNWTAVLFMCLAWQFLSRSLLLSAFLCWKWLQYDNRLCYMCITRSTSINNTTIWCTHLYRISISCPSVIFTEVDFNCFHQFKHHKSKHHKSFTYSFIQCSQ